MERYLEGIMGGGGGSNETGRDVAIGVGVDAVKNVVGDEVSSGVDNNGKELVEEAVGEEIKRRQNHVRINVNEYAGLLGRACPAGVYEYVADESESGSGKAGEEGEGWKGHKLVINSQVGFFFSAVLFFFVLYLTLHCLTYDGPELHSLQIM